MIFCFPSVCKSIDTLPSVKLYHQASKYQQTGKDSFLLLIEKSILLAKKENNNKQLTDNYRSKGVFFYYLGNYELAIVNYNKSLAIAEKYNFQKEAALCLINIGAIFQSRKNFPKAIHYYTSALNSCIEINDVSMQSKILNNLGMIAVEEKKYNRALDFFQKSLQIKIELKDSIGIAASYGNIGIAFKMQNKINQAIEYTQLSLSIFKALNKPYNIGINYFDLGKLFYLLKQENQAFLYYDSSLSIAHSNNLTKIKYLCYGDMYKMYKEKSDFKNLSISLEKYIALKDTLDNLEKSKQIEEIKTKYQTERKQKEIEVQKTQIALKEAEAGHRAIVVKKETTQIIESGFYSIGTPCDFKAIRFEEYMIKIEIPTTIYMFSDGYCDQFGGPTNSKFGFKNFTNLITEIQSLSLPVQKEKLVHTFSEWKENEKQIDDVLVVGIRFC